MENKAYYTHRFHLNISDKAYTALALSYESYISPYDIAYFDANSSLIENILEIYAPEWDIREIAEDSTKVDIYWGCYNNEVMAYDELLDFFDYLNSCTVEFYGITYIKPYPGFITAINLDNEPTIVKTCFKTVNGEIKTVSYKDAIMGEEDEQLELTYKHKEYLNIEIRFWENRIDINS